MVDRDGMITEGTSTNAWIVTQDNRLLTHNANASILNGITRIRLLALAGKEGLSFEERPFTVAEAYDAHEAFLTSSTNFVLAVTRIDGRPVGNGHPGLFTGQLRAHYMDYIDTQKETA